MFLGLITLTTSYAQARDFLRFSGSGTVFPYVSAAVEKWVKQTNSPAPVVEQVGTGAGFKNFCSGMGDNSADVAMASRPIKPEEWQACKAAGVSRVIALPFGYDGIVIVEKKSSTPFNLTRADLFSALAAMPKMAKNTSRRWTDINAKYPARPIRIYGPGVASGTRDAFVELAMVEGGKKLMPNINGDEVKKMAAAIRQDGVYVDSADNYNLIINKLQSDGDALGIVGYDYLMQNQNAVAALPIDGIAPSLTSIRSKQYPLARTLYLYVKADRLTAPTGQSLNQFLNLFLSEANIGDGGSMAERGLITFPAAMRANSRDILTSKKLLP
ncbi:MAG: substrate-binding domain-containing protein [Alphaproteobacteria bacterium]|nr:substrate-binding domain-containing protein [Alphaproteobacteria bacterium]